MLTKRSRERQKGRDNRKKADKRVAGGDKRRDRHIQPWTHEKFLAHALTPGPAIMISGSLQAPVPKNGA
ncbi:hypothetical protein DL89DRAFT_25720 [Linderina pennispora]|uniref:Uncharacterized protein n=1 Tax=Linderina pennispora TaxID=61395 RepID=A0A1Y1WPE3_9FUNG|nr:uncharacterized protein DL89DRAFT_25720 [Linderina pennispora]ORX74984.1 hypothetical protein DL89DRAFT_25720 [Linderina pennispora]